MQKTLENTVDTAQNRYILIEPILSPSINILSNNIKNNNFNFDTH